RKAGLWICGAGQVDRRLCWITGSCGLAADQQRDAARVCDVAIMSSGQFTQSADGFGTLRQLARRERPLERCELCSVGLRPDHPHLIEVAQRKLLCTCDGCAIL